MLTVTIRRYNQKPWEAIVAQARTSDPREAIARVGARKLGYRQGIGLCEHFAGGGTYHVQFVTGYADGSTSLSDKYIAQVEA